MSRNIPSAMPCPVCGALVRLVTLGTSMTDDALNISEAIVRCPDHGEHEWVAKIGALT